MRKLKIEWIQQNTTSTKRSVVGRAASLVSSSRIADIWPHILKISLLPAKNDKTTSALVGCVVSSALEAKDSATAASVWEFLRSSRSVRIDDALMIQLLGTLRDKPHLVVELVTDLLQGKLGVRALVKHLNAALQDFQMLRKRPGGYLSSQASEKLWTQ